MIIVNQDQSLMLNFNSVSTISIDNNLGGTRIIAEDFNNVIVLGRYETPTRTREVFMELNKAIMDNVNIVMPKE